MGLIVKYKTNREWLKRLGESNSFDFAFEDWKKRKLGEFEGKIIAEMIHIEVPDKLLVLIDEEREELEVLTGVYYEVMG